MSLFNQRKGITPVIAIVLLLMVTVGAVGVVYTQFNQLVGDPGDELEEQQLAQDTEIRIAQGWTDESLSSDLPDEHNAENYGTVNLMIQNTGSVARNTTAFVLTAEGGDATGTDCFQAESSEILDPGDTYTCDTDVVYPDVTDSVSFEVLLTESSQTWSFTCRHVNSGDENC